MAAAGRGVRLPRVDGHPLTFRDWALVRVAARGAAALARQPGVRAIRVPPPSGRPPLDQSAALLGLDAARGAGGVDELRTGQGVLIADVDSLVDVYHPDLFRGDGGWYDWIDADGDGHFTPGADAIDLNGDGQPGSGERAHVLRADLIDLYGNSTTRLTAPRFDPAVDWLYLDANGDGARNFGATDGFSDDDPAFGEPLFVPDDVNGNGALDPEERLVRLGTSKLKSVYVRIDYPGLPMVNHVYERGVDLSALPNDFTGGIYGYADALHATGVQGILAAGVPLPSRRFVGIAPDAEIVSTFEIADTNMGALMWAYAQDPAVVLHEYVEWTFTELDGSDTASELIDSSTADGVVNVCPAGNIGESDKHVSVTVGDGETASLTFRVPSDETQVYASLHARGDGTLAVALVEPGGASHALRTSYASVPVGSGSLSWYGSTTSRATQMQHFVLQSPPVSSEAWEVRVTATGGSLVVHGMLSDDQSGFGTGAAWDGATPESTVAWPATADSCIAVGAIPCHTTMEGPWYSPYGDEGAGQIRAYSGRGPRIDGDSPPAHRGAGRPLVADHARRPLPEPAGDLRGSARRVHGLLGHVGRRPARGGGGRAPGRERRHRHRRRGAHHRERDRRSRSGRPPERRLRARPGLGGGGAGGASRGEGAARRRARRSRLRHAEPVRAARGRGERPGRRRRGGTLGRRLRRHLEHRLRRAREPHGHVRCARAIPLEGARAGRHRSHRGRRDLGGGGSAAAGAGRRTGHARCRRERDGRERGRWR